MRRIWWILLAVLVRHNALAQVGSVGFADSILVDTSQTYRFGNYQGGRPLPVLAWFPSKLAGTTQLTFGELLLGAYVHEEHAWQLQQGEAILSCWADNGFVHAQSGDQVTNLSEIQASQQMLMRLSTAASQQQWPQAGDFRVIIYHHGSRGFAAENHVLAEKWAAAGFLVLAADFHLPQAERHYGLVEGIDSSLASLRMLYAFARQLSGDQNIFLAGHSWGAQQAWRFLAEDDPNIAGFISLETTLEYKTDGAEIADKWPFLYESLVVGAKKVKVPVLAVASQRNGMGFPFFKDKSVGWQTQVVVVPDFSHEAFTSLLFLRLHVSKQPDDEALRAQLEVYNALGEYLMHFLKSPGTAFPQPPEPQKFRIIYCQP